jgi:hypothetical protein
MARLTKLGWTCVGCPEGKRLGKGSTHFARTYFARDRQMLDEIDNNIKQFWEIENSGVRADNYGITTMSKEDQFALTTERRLKKAPEAEKAYCETIHKYIEKGYVRKVSKEEIQPDAKWFLPHLPVIRLDKTTTKLRIVFDASAKCEGTSLNDTIHQGPKLQREIVDVLLIFRKEPVAVVGDVADEMYLQVRICEEDFSGEMKNLKNINLVELFSA